ncbi:DUF2993 domain-containing protein [Actinobacteria bacterium YIM 96077]|uniref:DUF2993 domain-containing protein n=1 Tax=Phytoactinopolyspora halophila TaxID=1981511 RepID=A0A329QF11_9ACTN|nr:DUF2993 domain-containing protein [Actinobacteria bacterium YIM 96077]RAW09862.1 hypothetical protein DPM12_20185 [Phytoactinopolyspora halophila]
MHGVPFLTQVTSGRYDEVTIRMSNVQAEGVQLRDVELISSHVTASLSTLVDGSGSIRAGRIEGTAVVSYATVASLTGVDRLELSAADGDTVDILLPVDVMGAPATLTGTGSVTVDQHFRSTARRRGQCERHAGSAGRRGKTGPTAS